MYAPRQIYTKMIPATETGFGVPFIPPIPGPTLLLHFEGLNGSTVFIDSIGRHTQSAVGTAQISTAQSRFGTGSLSLLGGGVSNVRVDGNLGDWAFNTDVDFTIDMWTRITDITFAQDFIDTSNGIRLLTIGDGTLKIFSVLTGTTIIDSGSVVLFQDQWQHLAVTRAGPSLRMFAGGIQAGATYTNVLDFAAPTVDPPAVGGDFGLNNAFIDEVRLVKGYAVWTSNFSPPSAPYLPA